MNRLDEIEARTTAATEGPWELLGGGEYVSGPDILVAPDDGGVTSADAEFIAHARQDAPALVAALRAVLGVHARLTHPFYAQDVCAHPSCTDQDDHMDQAPWPCPTVAAIRQHLGEDA